jgi:proline iminopeptidase
MFIEVNGARIFFDVVGAKLAIDGETMREKPTMLVLHGGPGFDHAGLRPYFDRFGDTHQVIFIDHRGNGRSGGGADSWTLAQWGDDIHGFCQALGIDKPIVYGLSFGGMVTMSYAARHPEAPAKLILASTAAVMDLAATYDVMEKLGGAEARTIAERFWQTPSVEATADYMRVCMPLYNPSGAINMAVRKRSIIRNEVMMHFIDGEQRTMNLLEGLAAVSCPTLVLGGALDPITPPACSEAIFQALPDGFRELVMFEAAGHGVHRDQPDEAEAVLRGFMSA